MSVSNYVHAIYPRDGDGLPVPPVVGLTLVADGAGGAIWAGGQIAVPNDVEIYVDSTYGDDSNDGSLDYPLGTLDAALTRVESTGWVDSARIWLQPGNFPLPAGRSIRGDAGPGAKNTPLVIAGAMRLLLGTMPVGVAALVGGLLEVGGISTTPAMEGQRLTFVSGVLAGQSALVSVIDSFTLAVSIDANAPAPGDIFIVERSAATIECNTTSISGGVVEFRDLDVAVETSLAVVNADLRLNGVHVYSSVPIAAQLTLSHGKLSGAAVIGDGVAGGQTIGLIMSDRSALQLQGGILSSCSVFGEASNVELIVVRVFNCFILIDGCLWSCISCRLLRPIFVAQMSRMTLAMCDVSDSVTDGLILQWSEVVMADVGSVIPNTGRGMYVGPNSKMVRYYGFVGITGVLGDVQVGSLGIVTWTQLYTMAVPRNDYSLPGSVNASVSL